MFDCVLFFIWSIMEALVMFISLTVIPKQCKLSRPVSHNKEIIFSLLSRDLLEFLHSEHLVVKCRRLFHRGRNLVSSFLKKAYDLIEYGIPLLDWNVVSHLALDVLPNRMQQCPRIKFPRFYEYSQFPVVESVTIESSKRKRRPRRWRSSPQLRAKHLEYN